MVWKILRHQGSPLGFCRILSPLGLDDITSPSVPPLGFAGCHSRIPLFVTLGFPLGFGKFYVTKYLPWVSQALVTKESPLFFTLWFSLEFGGFTSPMVPPWVSQDFVTQRCPIGFGRFYITKGLALGFTGFLSSKAPPLGWKILRYQGFPFGFRDSSSTKVPPLVYRVFVTQGFPLCLEDFSSPRVC